MYKYYIITQAWVYLLITLAKQRAFVGKSDMMYDCPVEAVPEQFFWLVCGCFLQLQSSKTYAGACVQYVMC